MGLYGDIFGADGETVITTYLEAIRNLCGNPRPEVVPDDSITAARASASERVERRTRRYNVGHSIDEVELYNLMGNATNYFASVYLMTPFNDKQEVRKINYEEAEAICNAIMEGEDPTDPTTDPTSPIVSSDYATSYLANDGIGDGLFYVTKYGNQQW